MRQFIIEQSNAEIVSNSGLALIGMALNKHTQLGTQVNAEVPLRHGIPHQDVLFSYVGLLSIGKSEFDAIENVREDNFFVHSLGIDTVQSAATLRQRMDNQAQSASLEMKLRIQD